MRGSNLSALAVRPTEPRRCYNHYVPLTLDSHPGFIITAYYVLYLMGTVYYRLGTCGVNKVNNWQLCIICTIIVLELYPYHTEKKRICCRETTKFELSASPENMTSSGCEIIKPLVNIQNTERYTSAIKTFVYCTIHMTSSGCELFDTICDTRVYRLIDQICYSPSSLIVLFLWKIGLECLSTLEICKFVYDRCSCCENTSMNTTYCIYLFTPITFHSFTVLDLVARLCKHQYG